MVIFGLGLVIDISALSASFLRANAGTITAIDQEAKPEKKSPTDFIRTAIDDVGIHKTLRRVTIGKLFEHRTGNQYQFQQRG